MAVFIAIFFLNWIPESSAMCVAPILDLISSSAFEHYVYISFRMKQTV